MQPNPPIRTAEECRALQAEIRELRITVSNLNQQIEERKEAIRQLTLSVSNHRAQIDALTRNAAAEASVYQQSIDELRTTMTIRGVITSTRPLYEKVDSDTNLIQTNQREQDEATSSIIALQARMIEQHERIERYADDNAVLSQHKREKDARDAERERVERECIDYIHQNDGIEVCDTLLGDIHRAGTSLAPHDVAISHRFVGGVIWVSATWDTPSQTDVPLGSPTTLRIEFDPIDYNTSKLPPTFKITQGGEQFPVGHRIVHMMRLYMGRCWGRGGGFTRNLNDDDGVTREFEYDADPRCVVPYVVEEGGLVAHLVRYAMLRMETYADFCVVCDRPVVDVRSVICGSVLCDYSFHELGVGHASVGLDVVCVTHDCRRPRSNWLNNCLLDNAKSEPLTVLLLTHVLSFLPRSLHHAYVCSAGSKGYCALKEMLQNGKPGNTLLLESDDLRNVESINTSKKPASSCCLVYTTESMYDEPIYYSTCINPTAVPHITLYSNLRVLPIGLLKNCSALTTVDLSPLMYVQDVGPSFLKKCSGLSSLDLSPLSNVTMEPHSFLEGCTGLTSIDLSPLSNVTTLGNTFLMRCTNLTTLDLSPLTHVTRIGHSFLRGCVSLSRIDLSPLHAVTEISDSFLMKCTGLKELDLSPLSQISVLPRLFLSGCTGLKHIDMSPLSNISEIPSSFLQGCTGITTMDLSGIPQTTGVGTSFLEGCGGLQSLDLSSLSHLKTVHSLFLEGCSGLKTLDLSPLSQVTKVQYSFLQGCSGLTTIDLSPLSQVTEVGRSFLQGCRGLTTLDLKPLSSVVRVDLCFLAGCSGLTRLDLRPLSQVMDLEESFLQGCTGLMEVDVPPSCFPPPGWIETSPNQWTRVAPPPLAASQSHCCEVM